MVPLAGLVSMRKAVNRAELAGALSPTQARDERERLDVGIRTLREAGLEGIRIKIVEPYRLFEETRKVERRAKKKSRRAAKLARRRSRGR